MEKAYRAMKNSGAGSIAVGIIVLVVGVTAGGLFLIKGAGLLRHQKENIFLSEKDKHFYRAVPYS